MVTLRKELKSAQSSLLSSRTNQRVEQDCIRKAAQKGTAAKDEALKQFKDKNKAAERMRRSDEKNIRKLSQDKFTLKQLNKEMEERLMNVLWCRKSWRRNSLRHVTRSPD